MRCRGPLDPLAYAVVNEKYPSGVSTIVHNQPTHRLGCVDPWEFLDAVWKAFPDLTFEMIEGPYVIPGEPRSAVYARGRATHTGRLDPPGFAATGRRWEATASPTGSTATDLSAGCASSLTCSACRGSSG
jgi:hypothetical protein